MTTCPEWGHDILFTFQFSRWRRRDHAGSRDLKTDRIHDLIDVLNSQHNVDLLKTPDCDLWCSPVKITFTWDFMRWRSRKSGSRNMNEKREWSFPLIKANANLTNWPNWVTEFRENSNVFVMMKTGMGILASTFQSRASLQLKLRPYLCTRQSSRTSTMTVARITNTYNCVSCCCLVWTVNRFNKYRQSVETPLSGHHFIKKMAVMEW